MRVKAIKTISNEKGLFFVGQEFTTTKLHAEQLIKAGLVEEVEQTEEEKEGEEVPTITNVNETDPVVNVEEGEQKTPTVTKEDKGATSRRTK